MPWPLNLPQKEPLVPLNQSLGGPHAILDVYEEINLLSPPRFEPKIVTSMVPALLQSSLMPLHPICPLSSLEILSGKFCRYSHHVELA